MLDEDKGKNEKQAEDSGENINNSVGQVPEENMGLFHRLKIVENEPVHHQNSQITEVVDKPFSVADGLLRRLYAGGILIGVRYKNNRVLSVMAYLRGPEDRLIDRYQMHPVCMVDRNLDRPIFMAG